ncbi:carbohydrate ABC transporter permease [Carnobacterium gallinarum]|uniref:carbohydrate ABC transporter permease n=1 Tax=Carnobacterium gallinarum TaxID=2749 RepID=UPI0005505BC7|nr:carbohydrate ABC transporter permease [Carnobacterium gallinarum]
MKKKILCFTVLIVTLYPICFVFLGSLMGDDEVKTYLELLDSSYSNSFVSLWFFPNFPTLKSYVELLVDTPAFFVVFWNSVKSTTFILVGQVLINVPASWWFAQSTFKGKQWLYRLYIVLMVLPFVVMMLPQYIMLKQLGLLDTLWAIILPAIFSTLSIFIIYPYFKAIPRAIIESAKIDGANEWQIFSRIGVPICLPAIIISIMLNLFEYWGSVEQIIAFIKNQSLWTLPLFISSIQVNKANLALVSAVIVMVIPLLFTFLSQRYLTNGLLSNAEEK